MPVTSELLAGRIAAPSLDVTPTVRVAAVGFHTSSTALTITLKGTPTVCTVGMPVLPTDVPGAATSPGSSSCSLAKGPTITAKLLLVTLIAPLLAVMTFVVPTCVTATGCVNTPLEKATDVVGVIMPAVVVKATVPPKLVTVLLKASRAVTVSVKGTPACCVVLMAPIAKLLSVAEVTVNGLLMLGVKPDALAVSCLFVPALSIRRPLKMAVPEPVLSEVVPCSSPLPALRVTEIVTLPGKPMVEKLPDESRVSTIGWGTNELPAVALPGWVEKASVVAVPALTLKLVLSAIKAPALVEKRRT